MQTLFVHLLVLITLATTITASVITITTLLTHDHNQHQLLIRGLNDLNRCLLNDPIHQSQWPGDKNHPMWHWQTKRWQENQQTHCRITVRDNRQILLQMEDALPHVSTDP